MKHIDMPPIQQRIMTLLSDGYVHDIKQLIGCIDEQATVQNVRKNIFKLREILRRETHLDVVAYNGHGYRLVQTLSIEE